MKSVLRTAYCAVLIEVFLIEAVLRYTKIWQPGTSCLFGVKID